MKVCSVCDKEKDDSEFYKSKRDKDGLRGACKCCMTAYRKEYDQANKGKKAAYQREYYQNNKEMLLAKCKKYRQTPTGKVVDRTNSHKRRAQKMGAGYEKFDSLEIFERDNWRCQHCGKKVRPDYKNPNHPLYPNLDHIVCLSNGGSHTRKNTQLLCHKCNSIKNNNDSGEQLRLF